MMAALNSIKQYLMYYIGSIIVISLCIHNQALKELLMRLSAFAVSVGYISNTCQLFLGDIGKKQFYDIEHWATTGLFTVIAVIVAFTLGVNCIIHFLE